MHSSALDADFETKGARSSQSFGMGDRTTFQSLFHSHFRYVMRLAQLYGLPERDAKDVAQEVFVALHQAIGRGRFDLSAPPKPWLRTITYRVTRDYRLPLMHQGQPSDIVGNEIEPMDQGLLDTGRRVAIMQQWDLVFELLEEMSHERRTVFVLHEIEELTMEEIAEELQIPLGTVQSRLRAARSEFDEALRRRRATERRTMRGAQALLLPLSASSLLRVTRALPWPAPSTTAEVEVWSRVQHSVQHSIGPSVPPQESAPEPPHQKRLSMTRGRFVLATGMVFIVGAVTGAGALRLLHPSPEARVPQPARVLAVIPVGTSYSQVPLPAAFVPSLPYVSASVTPVVTIAPSAPPDNADEAERHCLEAARVKLIDDPQTALNLLRRCEQSYPDHMFSEIYDTIRQRALAALAVSGAQR